MYLLSSEGYPVYQCACCGWSRFWTPREKLCCLRILSGAKLNFHLAVEAGGSPLPRGLLKSSACRSWDDHRRTRRT